MKRYIVASLLVLLGGAAAAQSSRGQFTLSGAGTASCGQYIAASSNEKLTGLYVSWAQGFLSGMNMGYALSAGREFIPLPDNESIKAYLDKYCRDNPLKQPLDGTVALYRELRN